MRGIGVLRCVSRTWDSTSRAAPKATGRCGSESRVRRWSCCPRQRFRLLGILLSLVQLFGRHSATRHPGERLEIYRINPMLGVVAVQRRICRRETTPGQGGANIVHDVGLGAPAGTAKRKALVFSLSYKHPADLDSPKPLSDGYLQPWANKNNGSILPGKWARIELRLIFAVFLHYAVSPLNPA